MAQLPLNNGAQQGTFRGNLVAMFTEIYAAIGGFVSSSLLGQPNGVATLDATGKIPTGQLPSLGGGGDALVANPLSQFASTTSLQLKNTISDETGSGALVFANSPVLVTPNLGVPSTLTLTNATGLPISGISGLATGIAAWLAAGTSATLAAAISDETGSSTLVFSNAPTISAPTLTGLVTTDGANITTANAMGAFAIDSTKGLNTKSISANATFTFSAQPSTANTWFGLHVSNTDTNPHILTFPSSFSIVTQGARTTCPLPAGGKLWLMFRWDGSAYHVYGDSAYLSNFAATAAPAVGNDNTQGYGPGSLWGDATANVLYWCESNATGAAVWNAVAGGGGSGDMILSSAQIVTGAKTFNDGTLLLAGATSGTVTIKATAVAGSNTWTVPAATDQAVGRNTTDTLTNKSLTSPTITGGTADGNSIGYKESPINSQSAAYTLVLSDSSKTIFHPAADTTARTFTIPANSSVAYPVGTVICFDNDVGAGALTIAITTDVMVMVGAAGLTGNRTLAAGGRAVAIKVSTTRWRISGSPELT